MKAYELGSVNPENRGDQVLYKMDPPLDKYEYVVSSAVETTSNWGGPETYLFGADDNGEIIDWLELSGSQRGYADPARAIRNAGYEIIEAE